MNGIKQEVVMKKAVGGRAQKVPVEEYNLSHYDVKKRKRLVLHFTHDIYCPENYKVDFRKLGKITSKVKTEKTHKIFESLFPKSQGFNVGLSFSCDEEKIAAIEPKKTTVLIP
jgi:hypothetical protein